MTRVIIESPLSAPTWRERAEKVRYAVECLRDSLRRGESPLASHLLYSRNVAEAVFNEYGQEPSNDVDLRSYGALDDSDPADRKLGMSAGWAWMEVAEKQVVYVDLGVSSGMKEGIKKFMQSSSWHGDDCPIRYGASADCVPGYECVLPILFRSIRGLPQAELDRIRDETFAALESK